MKENLEPNIDARFKKYAEAVGIYETEFFYLNQKYDCLDNEIDSPIEQLVYTGLKTVSRIISLKEAEPQTLHGELRTPGLLIQPQFPVGKYRVDFRISYEDYSLKKTVTSALVECDSQQFHDRTEAERQYEKQRDRFLQSQGHRTFHFTGKEINDDPIRVACEILGYVANHKPDDIYAEVGNFL